MHEHDRLAAIDLLEDGRECRLPQQLAGITRQDTDAVELEHIERVFDLFQAAVGVRQWDGGEHPEAAGKVPHHLGAEFVAHACPRACGLAVLEPYARARHRVDGRRYARLIHLLNGTAGRPILDSGCGGTAMSFAIRSTFSL